MSQQSLNLLERDVEQARARMAGDLIRLRSPETLSSFKDELRVQSIQIKDEVLEKAKTTATDAVEQFVTGLKERAISNPAAALAVGAGLAWRLVHRPPIASLLVGVGLFSLWRTRPDDDGLGPRAAEMAVQVKEKLQDLTEDAGETLTDLMHTAGATTDKAYASAREALSKITETATSATNHSKDVAQEVVTQVRGQIDATADKAYTALREMSPSEETRNSVLLGAAALSVAAALGIAYQRRSMD